MLRTAATLTLAAAAAHALEFSYDGEVVYTAVADVTPHASIALDVADMKTALSEDPVNYAGADVIYVDGKNSAKSSGMRTLQGFGQKDLTGEPLFDEFVAFYEEVEYQDIFSSIMLDGTDGWDARLDVLRTTAIQKNNMCMMAMYANHEAELAIAKAVDGIAADDGTNNKYYDEYFAFYFGLDGTSAPIEVSRKRDADFGTTVEVDALASFNAGQVAALAADADGIRFAQAEIIMGMTITYLQATYKYAYKHQADPEGTQKEWSEGYTYWRCIAGHVHGSGANGATAADMIESAFTLDQAEAKAQVFCIVQDAIINFALPSLGMTAADLGTLTGDHGNSLSIPEDFCDVYETGDTAPIETSSAFGLGGLAVSAAIAAFL